MLARRVALVAALVVAVVLVGCSASAPAGPAQTRPPGSLYLSARYEQFGEARVVAPADAPFQLWFDNLDVVPHNVHIVDAAGTSVAQSEVFTGPSGKVLNVPALAAGTYKLVCDIHPVSMRSELVVN